ncbi:MAG: FxsA family protein [Bdellovibrionaceae bacterium]|nr:FxsA family protein [Pseudobdellovibrionaceae bacterium]
MFVIPLPYFLLEIIIFSTWVHFYNFWDVFLLYLLPSLIGVLLFSVTGRKMLASVQAGFQQGKLPGDKVLHRGAILLGSLLLILPLFLTRIIGFILVIPGPRHLGIFIFKVYIFKRLSRASFAFVNFGTQPPGSSYDPPFERDVSVVDVTPIEITHTKTNQSEDNF